MAPTDKIKEKSLKHLKPVLKCKKLTYKWMLGVQISRIETNFTKYNPNICKIAIWSTISIIVGRPA